MLSKQGGMSLIEVLGALAISAILLSGLTALVDSSLADTKADQAGAYQAAIGAAAAHYLADNYGVLAISANIGVTKPVTLTALKNAGEISPLQAAANVYGQTPCLLVRARNASPTNPAIVLDALVVTEGGQAIGDASIAYVAAQAGKGGGYINSLNSAVAQGSGGAWSLSAATTPTLNQFNSVSCSGQPANAGHLVTALLSNGAGQSSQDFLYRNKVPGMDVLNQMQTPIGMANGAAVDPGTACGSVAAIATDKTNGSLLYCNKISGTWQGSGSSWKAPVDTYASLPAGDAVGDVRMVKNISRAFTVDPSGKWVALAVDQNGDMNVPGKLAVGGDANIRGDANIHGNATIDANATVGGGATVGASVIAGGAGTFGGAVSGQSVEAKDWIVGQTVQVWKEGKEGDVCHIFTADPKIILNRIGTIVLESRSPMPGHTPTALICSGVPGNARLVRLVS
ncbi:shufflon system plasmid conjugative transfer pilus tip adhesin PilV [Janthinobacterium agaricidamnosum]|uniref:Prepilin-type N-terminal cleavage/methylation domain protein n=1 Tax=Janthinobacterium agaricidamnosum NBRC 102515 = DSM 9628 TaxID=1349767 RepID=W0V0I6_9BURK|nr:shufflon system plasmid conjugative transfer pilus tip adhesin PilV [Janthinobacterium agaricidamnosum]CDG82344.1 prepilin-type N-terminal cleavage/methylation domain protein [Janthinobacterium agaricidamnosum NBRC 102515 = DSM 9628]